MHTSQYLIVRSLPPGLAQALARAQYGRVDVRVVASESTTISHGGGRGERGYACIVQDVGDTAVGGSDGSELLVGSYGGPNMFGASKGNRVDSDHEPVLVPLKGAVVTGTLGRSATVHVHPVTYLVLTAPTSGDALVVGDALIEGRTDDATTIARDAIATAGANTMTNGDRWTLCVFERIKGGYRTKYLADLARGTGGVAGSEACVASLVARGLLKRSSNGATQITTAGRNARLVEAPYEITRGYGDAPSDGATRALAVES